MSTPKIGWSGEFPRGELDDHIPNQTEQLIVAGDSEYTRLNYNENTALSFQIAALSLKDGTYKKYIHYLDTSKKERLSLSQIILITFAFMGIPENEIDGYHIVFVCHFCAAEFAMMKDRKQIAPYLEFLYHTVITFRPIEITLKLSNGDTAKVTFEVGDTMLLLPPTHRSLEKATSLLDEKYHKKELTQDEKTRMDLLLFNDKERFEEYAVHDADITLRLFIKLQYTLNDLNGSKDTRYTTIGSATVKHFKKGMDPKLFKSQFAKNNVIYQQGLNLARRAYMGGLNSSYHIGEIEGELILDIDFSSAYPTVMNLLEVSDFGMPIEKIDPFDVQLGEAS